MVDDEPILTIDSHGDIFLCNNHLYSFSWRFRSHSRFRSPTVKIGNQGKTSCGSSYSWLIIFLLDSSHREV